MTPPTFLNVFTLIESKQILVLYVEQFIGLSMNVINFSEARNQLKSVLDQVVNDTDCTIISRQDADDAVVMSLDYYNGLMETVHLLKSPANAAHLSKSIEQYRQGKTKQYPLSDDWDFILDQRSLV